MVYVPSYANMGDVCNFFNFVGVKESFKLFLGHIFALFLYATCTLHLPAFGVVRNVQPEFRPLLSVMSYVLWTLLIWTMFTYHYYVFGGRLKYATSSTWELRAAGICMITAPKLHKAMTFFGLIVSILAAFQCFVVDFLTMKFMPSGSWDHDVLFKSMFLKVHSLFCVLMASYCIFRIVYDPRILRARKVFLEERRAEARGIRIKHNPVLSVNADGWPEPTGDGPAECTICTTRWANRQLRCGHTLCCCCIAQISRRKACVTCPFCRIEVFNARQLSIIASPTTVPLIHCNDCGCRDDENCNERRQEEEEEQQTRRVREPSFELADVRDGAAAVLLAMPVVPSMGM